MVPQWLQATRQYAPDIPGGSASVQKRQNEANMAVQRGHQVLAQYTPEQLTVRTLLAEHGVDQAVQPGGAMPPAAAPAAAAAPPPPSEAADQAAQAAAEQAAKPAEKKPLAFDEMTSVGKDASSG